MRYTLELMTGVLNLYWPHCDQPKEASIISQFYYKPIDYETATALEDATKETLVDRILATIAASPQLRTELFFEHKRSVSVVPLLAHTYITFRDKVWHPGAPTNPIVDPVTEEELAGPLLNVKELCLYCARRFMQDKFEVDSHFHIICNNCQIQFGLFGDTVLVMMFIVLLIANIYEPSLLKSIFMIYVCFILVLVNTSTIPLDSVELFHCPHIKFGLGAVITIDSVE